jgi:Predicted metal-dependent hydrolase
MLKNIFLNGFSVEYELEQKSVKNINLRIHADGSIHVSIPRTASLSAVENFLKSKANYILKTQSQVKDAARRSVFLSKFEEGNTLTILGKALVIKLNLGKAAVDADGGTLYLTVKNVDSEEERRRVLMKWFNKLSKDTILFYCNEIYPSFEKVGVAFPTIRFRQMTSRWGVCNTRTKTLTFNTALLSTSPECIRYVVYHEFTHFLVPNHSDAFYSKLSERLPSWKACRRELKNYPL